MSIAMVALGELMPPKKRSVDPRKSPDEEFELFSIPAFDEGEPEVVSGKDVGSSKQILESGDVILSKIVPHIRRAWVVEPASDRPTIGSSEWIIFRSDRFDPSYLRHALVSDRFHKAFMQTVAGVGGSLLRARPSYVAEIKVPLPPIEEQRRIAAVLDAAEALQAKRRQAINVLDSLTQAIFTDMFGDPVQDETITRLGECVDMYSGSTLPEGEEFEGQVSGYALVKVSDLARDGNEKFINSTREWTPVKGPSASTCPSGSIVFPKRGAAIAKNRKRITTIPSVLDPNLMGVTPKSHSLTLPYLYAWFERLDLQSIQSGSSVPQLNKKDLAPLELKLPRIENQVKFAQLVGNVDSARAHMVQQLQQLDILFASLQQRAFRGEL